MKNKIMVLIALLTLTACEMPALPINPDSPTAGPAASATPYYVGNWSCTRTYTQGFSVDLSALVINQDGTMTVDGSPYDYVFDDSGATMQYAPDDQITEMIALQSGGISFRWQQGNESYGESGNASDWTCEPAN